MRWLLSLLLLAPTACAPPPPLAHTAPSAEALGRELLAALGRGDERRLHELAISAEEFERHVWPQLPAARAERNLPAAYLWGDLVQKSKAHLKTLLARHRGRRFAFDGLRFDGQTSDYGTYQVHRRAVLLVADRTGRSELRVSGSFIHKDGRWKVLSYVINE
jgi:hypothetical protein